MYENLMVVPEENAYEQNLKKAVHATLERIRERGQALCKKGKLELSLRTTGPHIREWPAEPAYYMSEVYVTYKLFFFPVKNVDTLFFMYESLGQGDNGKLEIWCSPHRRIFQIVQKEMVTLKAEFPEIVVNYF